MISTFDFNCRPLRLSVWVLILSLALSSTITSSQLHAKESLPQQTNSEQFGQVLAFYVIYGLIRSVVIEYLAQTDPANWTWEEIGDYYNAGVFLGFSRFFLHKLNLPMPPGAEGELIRRFVILNEWLTQQILIARTSDDYSVRRLILQTYDALRQTSIDAYNALTGQTPQPDPLAPVCTIVTPNGGEMLGNLFSVTASVVDASEIEYVEFQFSTDHTSWITLNSPDDNPATNDGRDYFGFGPDGWSLRFDVVGAGFPQAASVWVRARAIDSDGNISPWDESNGSFTVNNNTSSPALRVSPTYLDFGIVIGSQTLSQQFQIQNIGGGNLSWQTSETVPWMSLSSPQSGNLGSGQFTLPAVYVNTAGTHPGDVLVNHVTVTTNASIAYVEVIARIGGNQPPNLRNGDVFPDDGNTCDNTSFLFKVNYQDHDNDPPSYIRVVIDGVQHTMTTTDPYYADGSDFTFTSNALSLGTGSHNYYFECSDGNGGTDRYPTSGVELGPMIESGTPTMYVYEPDGNNDFVAKPIQSTYQIKWIATDCENDPLTIDLFYSPSRNTGNLIPITSGYPDPAGSDTGRYDWNILPIPQGSYYIYGISRDPNGQTEVRFSNGQVTISDSLVFPPVMRWTNPVAISASGIRPAIGADANGNVHVVWEDANQYARSADIGRTWSSPISIEPNQTDNDNSELAVDPQENVHFVWGYGGQIRYQKRSSTGQLLIATTQLTNSSDIYHEADIAIDNLGRIHVVWVDDRGSYNSHVFYIRSVDGGTTWSNENNPLPNASDVLYEIAPSIITDEDNGVYVVYPTGANEYLMFIRSLDGGQSWVPAVRIDQGGTTRAYVRWPQIISEASILHVAYFHGSFQNIIYKRSTDRGANWTPDRLITNSGGAIRPSLDAKGDTVVIVFDRYGAVAATNFVESFNSGLSWSLQGTVVSGPSVNPQVAFGAGVFHVVDNGIIYSRTPPFPNSPPTITITAPIGTALSDTATTIVWNTTDPDSGDALTVCLHYDVDTDPINKTLIACSLPGTGQRSWRTDLVPAGYYYIYAQATDSYGNTAASYSAGRVRVNHRPGIIVQPALGTTDTTYGFYAIRWQGADPDPDTLTIDLFYDPDRDTTSKALIARAVSNTGSYPWNIDTLMFPDSLYYLYGVIRDGVNNAVAAYSQGRVLVRRIVTSVQMGDNVPKTFSISNNYPNPFNPSTTFNFSIPHSSYVTLTIYDLLGREIKRLVDEQLVPGNYKTVWDGKNSIGQQISSGIYFTRIVAAPFDGTRSFVHVTKMVLLK